jgi:hypothetical protein
MSETHEDRANTLHPTKADAPPPPPPTAGTLPGSSVSAAELERGVADGLRSKGLPPERDPK